MFLDVELDSAMLPAWLQTFDLLAIIFCSLIIGKLVSKETGNPAAVSSRKYENCLHCSILVISLLFEILE